MIGTPLPGRATRAAQSALLSHGWGGASADAAANGLEPWAHHLTGLTEEQIEALLRHAPRYGVDLLTGDDWALVSATRSRLSALARSWSLPPELYEVVVAVGTGLPADPAPAWRTAEGLLDLTGAPLVFPELPPGVVELDADGTVSWPSVPAESGVLLVSRDPAEAMNRLTRALDGALLARIDPDRIALDPGWIPGGPSLGLFRRFGRPLMCTTDEPVIAAIARMDGAGLFRSQNGRSIRAALEIVAQV